MTNANKTAALTLALATTLLGSPAGAWSPLQYDTEKEVGLPEHSLIKDAINRLRHRTEQTTDPGSAAPEPSQQAADPQSAIEKDASSGPAMEDKLPSAQDDKDAAAAAAKDAAHDDTLLKAESEQKSKASDEATPATPVKKVAKKTPGKLPTEDVSDPQYFLDRAHSFATSGDYQSGLNYINKALELNPDFWEAWYEKGLIFQLAGYDGPAARRYLALIQRRPDMVQPHVALGSLYRKHGNYDLAEKEYHKAIDLNFYYFPAHYNLANLLMTEEHYEQALKEYKVCLKLQPDNAMVHNNLGVIYQHRNYLEDAAEEFEKASHLEPANQKFADNLSQVKEKISRKAPKSVAM